MTRLLASSDEDINRAADLLREGRLVAFPTETVYGLGADATNGNAVRAIFRAKGRPANNPLIVHVAGSDHARLIAKVWSQEAEKLASVFWPGPLTLIVPAGESIAREALAGGQTVGLRAPAHPLALKLLRAVNLPIAAPSANSSGQLSPVEAHHVMHDLEGRIDAVLDGGSCQVGIESTVLDLTADPVRVLRPGMISAQEFELVLNAPVSVSTNAASGEVLRSPGLLERHYAPRIPLRLKAFSQLTGAPSDVAVIAFEHQDVSIEASALLPMRPEAAARELYALLWKLQGSGAREIWIERPPDVPEWQAIHDRLQRASIPE